MAFRKFHGITMAANSFIENLNVERLSADPSPVSPGRLWYNDTTKQLKYSTLDAAGAVIVMAFISDSEVATQMATYDANIQAQIATEHTTINASIAALGNAFNYVGAVDGAALQGSGFDLDALPAGSQDIGDYHKVTTSGYFTYLAADGITPIELYANLNDGVVKNTAGGWDIIDNTNAVSSGTAGEIAVTGSVDTGFVIALDAAFTARMSTAEAGIVTLNADIVTSRAIEGTLASLLTTDKTNLVAAINEVQTEADANAAAGVANAANITTNAAGIATNATDLATETARATAAENANAAAIVTESTDRTAADAALQVQVDDIVAAAGDGAAALQTKINAKVAIYNAAAAALTHTFNHGLVGEDLSVELWVKDTVTGKFYNDSALVEMDPVLTTITVPLQVSSIIKLIVEDKTALV